MHVYTAHKVAKPQALVDGVKDLFWKKQPALAYAHGTKGPRGLFRHPGERIALEWSELLLIRGALKRAPCKIVIGRTRKMPQDLWLGISLTPTGTSGAAATPDVNPSAI